jgi:predicted TIM-barrel fold metal-dependent hydrolase
MIIDGETHPLRFGKDGGLVDSHSALLKCLDERQVDMACILPGGHATNIPSKLIEELARKLPNRFVPFCRFYYNNPVQPGGFRGDKERALEELAQMLQSGIFKGVGEFSIAEVGMDEPLAACREFYPFMDKIAKHQLLVQFHTGMAHGGTLSFYNPILLDELASRYPDIPFFVNHCGTMLPPFDDISLYLAAKNNNIYLLISCQRIIKTEPGKQVYKKFVSKALTAYGVGAEKLVYGTDWHLGSDQWMTNTLQCLSEIKMSENERSMIMGDNLKRLLKI